MNEYENMRRIVYGEEGATFVPVCEKYGRFVKADKSIAIVGERLSEEPNVTCSRCGRTKMIFEGFL